MSTPTIHQPDPAVVPAEVVEAVRGARRVALIGHVTPDGDCVASIAALWLALPELGITSAAVLPAGTVSRRMEYLVRLAGLTPATADEIAQCDLALVLDTAKDRRVNIDGKLDALPGVPVLNIDHHATNPAFGKWNWVVGHASSTSELVYHLLRALGCQVTSTIATLLYAGVHTDTQGFSLTNTTPGSLEVGHALAAAGANIHDVCEQMHRSQSRGEFELLKVVYANTRVSPDGRMAWSSASYAEISGAGCDAHVIDDQVEVPRSIEGIKVAILFTEGDPGKIRMNFRGEQGVSVLELAQQFGGGGHHASAGARIEGTLEEVQERVLTAARAFVATL
ncbi:MAG: DHH family phosphoesterase [Phycisphaerae bacterium]|jgi:phosphoesterase RecJ-like protein